MTGLSMLAAGAVLGVRHALDADHLAAAATLVDGERYAVEAARHDLGD